MTNPSLLKKSAKLALLFFGILVALVVITRIGLGVVGTQAELIPLLYSIAESQTVVWLRVGVYVLVFMYWGKLLKRFDPTLSEKFISETKRPLVVLIVLYEIVIVQQWQSFFMGIAG